MGPRNRTGLCTGVWNLNNLDDARRSGAPFVDTKSPGVAPAKAEMPADRGNGDKLPMALARAHSPGTLKVVATVEATHSLWLTCFFQGLTQEPMGLPRPPKPPELSVGTPPSVGHSLQSPVHSASQRERQALQDLLELAGERLPASPCSRDLAGLGGDAGETLTLRASPPWYQGCDGHSGPQSRFTLSGGRR